MLFFCLVPLGIVLYSAETCFFQIRFSYYNCITSAMYFAIYIYISCQTPLLTGVVFVLHCLPPNMNDQKPDCITDVQKATNLLKKCYENFLTCFYQIVTSS